MKKTILLLLFLALITCQDSRLLIKTNTLPEKNIGTCAKFTSDKESCLECVPHYHLFEGQCYIDIHGCSLYVFGNICRKCEHGFILVNNQCCDKHCMARIFKNYQVANEQSQLSEEQKVEKMISQGYEKTVQSLSIYRYQFVKFVLQSTSNQVLQGYIRYYIKILANDKPYRCIADFESDTKKVIILQFRPESQMGTIKQSILSQQDVAKNQEARSALQYASGKYGLRTYGSSLERVSGTTYKYAIQFKLIYIGTDSAMIIHVVVSLSNKKQTPYSPWSEQRKDVQAIKTFVQKSMSIIKMKNTNDLEMIKQQVSSTNQIQIKNIEMKSIEKVKDNVYKYTFVNEETKQVYQQVSRINPQTKKVEIIEHKEVIGKDIKNMVLPESAEKKIISKNMVTETIQVKDTIKYLEEVQPSLATKEIINAAVETIGENKKITLIQKKNDQISRVVVIHNQRTNERKLIDESPVINTPPTQTIYTVSNEGKPVVISNDVEKFKKNDIYVEKVITEVERKLPSINTGNIAAFEKTSGNLANTYQIVIKGQKPGTPEQQVTAIHNIKTNQVTIIDVEEIENSLIVETIKRKPTVLVEAEFQSTQVKEIISQIKKTKPQLKDVEIVVKKAEVQETQFVNQYSLVIETTQGETLTIKANKGHQEKRPQITIIKPLISKPTQQILVEPSYISFINIDDVTGVKTTTTTKKDDIKVSITQNILSEITVVNEQVKLDQIQSIVRKQFERTITETSVIKSEEKLIQVTVEQNKQTGKIIKINQQIVQIKIQQNKPLLPVICTTKVSEVNFKHIVKANTVLQEVTSVVIGTKPVFRDQVPITTEIVQTGTTQTMTFVYLNKESQEKERIIAVYEQTTKQTVIKQEVVLPRVIEKIVIQKDKTPQGDIKIISNKIEVIKKEDIHITQVMNQVGQKIPVVVENSINFQVIQGEIYNTYHLTAVEPTTKDTVVVTVSYNKQTNKVTVNDLQQILSTTVIAPRPMEKPVVILTPDQHQKPELKQVIKFVEKTINIQHVKQIKEVKNTLTTNYQIVTQTTSGIQTAVVVVNNHNMTEITLIDIKEQIKVQPPVPISPIAPVPSYRAVTIDSINVKHTTTNEKKTIQTNKYLQILYQQAVKYQLSLKNHIIQCFSEDIYQKNIHISYIAVTSSGSTVLVSGFVQISTLKVVIIQAPPSGNNLRIAAPQYRTCQQRSSTLVVYTKETITALAAQQGTIGKLVYFISKDFGPQGIQKIISETFYSYVKYVIQMTKSRKTIRVVMLFSINGDTYKIIEQPQVIGQVTQIILEQTVQSDGTKVVISNSIQQIKVVDTKIVNFINILQKDITINTKQITNIVSKESSNIIEYTLMIKEKETVSQVRAVYRKDDSSVLITQIKQQPQILIVPRPKPKLPLPKQQFTTSHIQNMIQVINVNQNVPNITAQSIVQITESKGSLVNSYQITTATKTGKQTYVITQNIKGVVSLIDYKPSSPAISIQHQVIKTELTVNQISGFQTQVTNDVLIIQQSKPIQSVISTLIASEKVTKNFDVVSAVTKTLESTVQTTIIMKSPEKPKQNIVVVAIVDSRTNQVTIVADKKVITHDSKQIITVQDEVIQTVYSSTVMEKTIKQDKILQKIVVKVSEKNKELVNIIPTEVVLERIGYNVIATVSYEGKKVSTLVYNQKTTEVTEIKTDIIPSVIKPIVFQTEKTSDGTLTVTTNSIEKVIEINKNFNSIVSEIKQSIPSIQTQKIQGIKIIKSQLVNAPQKIIVLFQSQKVNQLTQIAVIDQPSKGRPVIIDVQTILSEQIIHLPEPVKPIKLTQKEIRQEKIQTLFISNMNSLPFKEIRKIVEADTVQTAYTKIYDVRIETEGGQYIVKTQQFRGSVPKIIDYVLIPQVKVPQIFTTISTDPKNGIISTYTNDVKVMSEQKTFSKCLDALEKQKSLTRLGFSIDSQTVSKLQRTVQHHLRFINKQTYEGVQYRVIVDSRTGQITIIEETKFKLDIGQSWVMPAEKAYIEIPKSQLAEAMTKYTFIQTSLEVLRKADYTFQGKIPELTQAKQYKSLNSQLSSGYNAVEVVMTFEMAISGSLKKTRVVFLGEQKQNGKGYIMKIIDLTTLPDVIISTETKIVFDEFNRKTTFTNDIKSLTQTNEVYTKVVDKVYEQITSLKEAEVTSVVIKEFKNADQYTIILKKGYQIVQTKVTYDKVDSVSIITDFRAQSKKSQVQKVPIREVQSILSQVSTQLLSTPQYISLKSQIIEKFNFSQDIQMSKVTIEQSPKADMYSIKVVDNKNVESIITAFKNPTTNQISLINVNPVIKHTSTGQIRLKQSFTEVKVDSITGAQILITNDFVTIRDNAAIQQTFNNIVQQKSIQKKSQIISISSKTSEKTIQTSMVVQQPRNPTQQIVIITIAEKTSPEKVQIISQEVVDITQQTQQTIQTIVEQVVITRTLYQSVIKKDVHLQKIIKSVESKIPSVVNLIPVRVVLQETGHKIISQVSYQNTKVITVCNQNYEVINYYEEPIPKIIVPSTIETVISVDGTKIVTSTSTAILENIQPQFSGVMTQISTQFTQQAIKTVVSQETSFGNIYTLVIQKPLSIETQQAVYYYNKQTLQITSMGTEELSIISSQISIVPWQVKPIPETQWQTEQISSVISVVTSLTKEQKINKIQELKPSPLVKIYQVQVQTSKGIEVVKVTVDKITNEVVVLDVKPPIIYTPLPIPTVTNPSITVIKVDEVTGIKTTVTTDLEVIRINPINIKIQQSLSVFSPEVTVKEVVSVTTKQYEKMTEYQTIFKSEQTSMKVISIVDKQTQKVTILDSSKIDISSTASLISTASTSNEIIISQIMLQEVISTDQILKLTIEYVGRTLVQFQYLQPVSVSYEQFTNIYKYTLVYKINGLSYRILISYNKQTKIFEILEKPYQISVLKPLVFETIVTQQGRTNYFSNDVSTLVQHDKYFNYVFSELSTTLTLPIDQIDSIQSQSTSTGTFYTMMVHQGAQETQINVAYNKQTNSIKILDIQAVVVKPIEPLPRPQIVISRQNYQSSEIKLIVQKSIAEHKIPTFTVSQIIKVTKTVTTFGATYVFQIQRQNGKSVLTTSISIKNEVTIVSYHAPLISPVPTPNQQLVIVPSTTQFSVDSVTGAQIQITNDIKVIKQSLVVSNVVNHLIKGDSTIKDIQVVSTMVKTYPEIIQTILVIKKEEGGQVVVTVTDKKTNQVKILADKQITKEQIQAVNVASLVKQTVVSSTIYDEVVQKDIHLQTVIKQIQINHPQIKQTKPSKIVVERIGESILTQVNYQNISVSVVQNTKSGKTEEVYSTELPKISERISVVVEQKVNTEGTKVITSNKVEHIEKIVPQIKPAIIQISKIIPIKVEEIKTISTSIQQNKFTIITVDQTNKMKQVTFIYDQQKQTPIKLIDVQDLSQPLVPLKPKQIVFEQIKVQDAPQIITAIQTLNKTNTLVQNNVVDITKVEKSVTNFVEQYKVQVKTSTNQEATITFEMNPRTQQTTVIDIIKYIPQIQKPTPLIVEQKIDSITQTRQTVYPNIVTFKEDQTYPKVSTFLKSQIEKGYEIVSVIKQNYGENKEISVLLKSENKSPQQVQLNINDFSHEVTVLQNKTIVSHEVQEGYILNKDQPKTIELKLNPVDQQKFEIISKLSYVKEEDNFKTLPEIKVLQKNELFIKADSFLKVQFESILQQSNIVHVSTKQTLDTEQYKVYYINTERSDKQIYEAKIKLNPITQTFEVLDFTKIGTSKPEKSTLNVDSDIAYGYEVMKDFSNDKNVAFVVQEARKHYTTLSNAVIQSVEVLPLCNQRFNYKIFFKNGLQVVKYIIYFEQSFKRVIFIAGKQFSFGGGNYETLSKDELLVEGYFKNVNQFLKQKNLDIAEGSDILHVERSDKGKDYNYRVIYSKNGKTYHAQSAIDKDLLNVNTLYFNQIIQIPANQQAVPPAISQQFVTLRISDLAHNSNFEKVHRQILSKQGSFLQNAQLVGAQQKSEMFKIWYKFYFLVKQDYFKIEAQIDSTTKKVLITSNLEKVNTDSGFSVQTSSQSSQEIINWVQKNNPDLKSGVIVEVSSKRQIFGTVYKIAFKLQTKYYRLSVYKQGNDLKVLNQGQSLSLDSAPSVRSFPRPDRAKEVTLNRD